MPFAHIDFVNSTYKESYGTNIILRSKVCPSLLRQIVDEVDALNDAEKAELLGKIKLLKALSLARDADAMLEGNFKAMSEEEIAEMVSNNRKQRYEEKTRN